MFSLGLRSRNAGKIFPALIGAGAVVASLLLGAPSAAAVTTPSAPNNLAVTPGPYYADLTWTPPSSNGGAPITSYAVSYSRTSADGPWTSAGTELNEGIRRVNWLSGTTFYWLRVQAVNSAGAGEAAIVTTTTLEPVLPAAPPNLVFTPTGPRAATLAWGGPDYNGGRPILSYNIYAAPAADGPWSLAFVSQGAGRSASTSVLEPRTTYFVKVSATTVVGEGPTSNVASGRTPTDVRPSRPQNLTATPGNAQVTLNWDPPVITGGEAISHYTVYRSRSVDGPWALTASNVQGTSRVVTGLFNGRGYFFKVSATNTAGEGLTATTTVAATPSAAPSAPRELVATPGQGQVSLTWRIPADNGGFPVTGYTVSYATSAGGPWTVFSSNVTRISSTVTGLTNGTPYWFRVTASNSFAEGPAVTSTSSVTPQARVPGRPTNLVATPGNTQVTLTWDAPANNGGSPVSHYTVYRSTSANGPWALTASNVQGTSRVVTGLFNGREYWFRVSASNTVGEGLTTITTSSVTPNAG